MSLKNKIQRKGAADNECRPYDFWKEKDFYQEKKRKKWTLKGSRWWNFMQDIKGCDELIVSCNLLFASWKEKKWNR